MQFVARITGSALNQQSGLFEYDFREVIPDRATGSLVNGDMVSGQGVKALALCELGRQNTEPAVADGDVVSIVYTGMQFVIVAARAGALKDVRYSHQEDKFYKEFTDGSEEVWAESTLLE